MSKEVEEVITKCKTCDKELLVGQKFCTECGSKQDIPMRTLEEVVEMKKLIFKAETPEKSKAMMSLMTIMTIDLALSWVLGFRNDKDMIDMVTGKLGQDKGG